ncbi:MAG: hypothetical protein WAR37_01110 [Candidatus Microsaccharimonas sp.]
MHHTTKPVDDGIDNNLILDSTCSGFGDGLGDHMIDTLLKPDGTEGCKGVESDIVDYAGQVPTKAEAIEIIETRGRGFDLQATGSDPLHPDVVQAIDVVTRELVAA